MTTNHGHDHDGADDGAVDWFRLFDALVWVSVALIAALAAEWLIGYLVRERIARGADKYLAKVGAGKSDPDAE